MVRRRLRPSRKPERRRCPRRPSCTGHGWLWVGRTLCLARPRRSKRRFTGHGHGPLHPWKHGIGAAEVLGHGRGKFRTDAGQAKGVKEAAQGHPGRVDLRHHVPAEVAPIRSGTSGAPCSARRGLRGLPPSLVRAIGPPASPRCRPSRVRGTSTTPPAWCGRRT